VAKPGREPEDRGSEYEYLCVDAFIKTIVDARILATGLELGLIDYLIEHEPAPLDSLRKRPGGEERGLELVLKLLKANGVIEECRGAIGLSQPFRKALQYRDLLEAKLEFARFVVPDFADLFTVLIQSPDRFSRSARIFDLFDYRRCVECSRENYEWTKRWMRITTALTKHEARVCMRFHEFGRYRRLLDIGGNSGEFALQICKTHPELRATVFDLPLVCRIGQEHVCQEPEADRIEFVEGNALADTLPTGYDLITFKSVLHDWPEREAKHLILQASRSLQAGGTLLIFERGPFEVGEGTVPYSLIPFLLFFRSFRPPAMYKTQLEDIGFRDVTIQGIDLEMPFFLVAGVKEP